MGTDNSLVARAHQDGDMAERRSARSLVRVSFLFLHAVVFASEDVQLAIDHGLDGVIISNHGGRQLDGVPATLDALRECAPTAKGKIKIAMDGGIRRGSDLFKAVALGADFCWVGRPAIWGLAVGPLLVRQVEPSGKRR